MDPPGFIRCFRSLRDDDQGSYCLVGAGFCICPPFSAAKKIQAIVPLGIPADDPDYWHSADTYDHRPVSAIRPASGKNDVRTKRNFRHSLLLLDPEFWSHYRGEHLA